MAGRSAAPRASWLGQKLLGRADPPGSCGLSGPCVREDARAPSWAWGDWLPGASRALPRKLGVLSAAVDEGAWALGRGRGLRLAGA
jgi:hypothetical protein